MSKKIVVDIGLNTSDIAKGAKDGERALEKLESAVADAGRSGRDLNDIEDGLKDIDRQADKTERAVGDVESAAKDAGRDGSRELDDLEDSLRDVQRQSQKTERAVDDIGDGGRSGFGKASEASSEFKDEALSNISEIASSFDGSMESIGELAQGTLGGLATSTIPGIAAAAVPAAAAIGLITSNWEKVQEATEEARESAYEYGLTVAASGDFAATADRLRELTQSTEGLKKVQDLAVATGWDQKRIVTALATGDGLPALKKAFDENSLSTNIAMGRLSELQGVITGTAEGFDLATDAAHLNDAAMYDLVVSTGKATGKMNELGQQIYAMPDGTEIVVDAKTKTAREKLDDVADQTKKLPDGSVDVKYSVDDRRVRGYRPPTLRGTIIYEASQGGAYNSRRQPL